ncbi:MAG: B12-binding domain-containing radical SAM protein [Chloroflexi bacterium]|nr:B12-binding domain-containing radical SAM protein [Chloroflexota bacterium]
MLVLYNPPSSARRKPVMPLALLALGALLEDRHDYAIVDGNLDRDALGTIDALVRDGADMLGVTVMPGPQLADAVPLCRELKRRHPHLRIIWGGYFPTQHWDVSLKSGYVDYVVRGHGEVIFQTLIDRLAADEDPTDIPGLAYCLPDGMPYTNPTAPIPHPNLMPEFPYHRIDVPRYARSSFMGKRTLAHHSSYGCPFFCNFCAVVNMVGGRWLAQSAERTANVTRRLVTEWGADAVEFYDNNFFVHEARTVDFAERILDLDIGWWGDARIDTLLRYSDRSWELMRDSGLRMVFMGAESGSDETLQRMNKGGSASTEKTLFIAEKMRAYNIVPEFSFVLGNPPDPQADVDNTLAFIRKVKRVNPHTEIIMYVYTPVPLAGELYEEAKAEGFAFPRTLEEWISDDWQDFAQRRSSSIPWLADPIRRHMRDFERVLSAYYPTITNPNLRGARRLILRAASAWRYHLGFYSYPFELRPLQKILAYQRPETCGF